METIQVELGERGYPIHVGSGLLANEELLTQCIEAEQVLVVTNEIVAPLYLGRVERALAGRRLLTSVLPDGERHKTVETFSHLIDDLIDAGFHRDACIVALGGGVVGDVAGFAAASYQRGIDFVQVPTTLLAQVDSSVGGKTAVNHPRAKNMIGAFYQPRAVLSDTDTLSTLPTRELAAGLAEVIKYGLILDAAFFGWLEQHIDELVALDADALRHAIRRSCELKAAVVAADEREQGQRALLNLGHTFGHALEAIGEYRRWLHGEAVAIGMSLAARTSQALGFIDTEDCRRIDTLLDRAGLPIEAPGVSSEEVLSRMQLDKKAGRGGLKVILLEGIGRGVVAPAPDRPVLERVLEG